MLTSVRTSGDNEESLSTVINVCCYSIYCVWARKLSIHTKISCLSHTDDRSFEKWTINAVKYVNKEIIKLTKMWLSGAIIHWARA